MTKKKVTLMRRLKMAFLVVARNLKRMVGTAREKGEIDRHFSMLAQKWDRLQAGLVNWDSTFFGIFDRDALTLTVRVEGHLERGELITTNYAKYRVDQVRPGRVEVPVEVDQTTHLVSCKVAVLAKL